MSFAIEKYISDYSIFTNLKADHLNWHKDLQEYSDAKMNLVAHTKKRSIINEQVFEFARENQLSIVTLGNMRIFGNDIAQRDSTDGDSIRVSGQRKYRLSDTNFSGIHNAMNILACVLVANEM